MHALWQVGKTTLRQLNKSSQQGNSYKIRLLDLTISYIQSSREKSYVRSLKSTSILSSVLVWDSNKSCLVPSSSSESVLSSLSVLPELQIQRECLHSVFSITPWAQWNIAEFQARENYSYFLTDYVRYNFLALSIPLISLLKKQGLRFFTWSHEEAFSGYWGRLNSPELGGLDAPSPQCLFLCPQPYWYCSEDSKV